MWVLFELLCCWCVLGMPLSVSYGVSGWAMQTAIGYLSTYIDYVCYPHFKKNMQTLKKKLALGKKNILKYSLDVNLDKYNKLFSEM